MSLPLLKFRLQKIEANRLLTPEERVIENQKSLSFWTNFGLGLAVVIGFIVILAHRGVVTAAIAAFGAALGSGGVLGFLFGVPSAPKGDNAGTSTSTPGADQTPVGETAASSPDAISKGSSFAHYSVSNLEQVADWVTKLLLGGGLTQMQRIPPMVWRWSQIVAWGIMGNTPATPERALAEQAFAAGLLVYGFILGFFSGFLITKLQLGKAIAD